jgi:hypothetical protein
MFRSVSSNDQINMFMSACGVVVDYRLWSKSFVRINQPRRQSNIKGKDRNNKRHAEKANVCCKYVLGSALQSISLHLTQPIISI